MAGKAWLLTLPSHTSEPERLAGDSICRKFRALGSADKACYGYRFPLPKCPTVERCPSKKPHWYTPSVAYCPCCRLPADCLQFQAPMFLSPAKNSYLLSRSCFQTSSFSIKIKINKPGAGFKICPEAPPFKSDFRGEECL